MAFGSWVAQTRAAARRRKALAALLEMDDYRLWDIGIARADLAGVIRSDGFDINLVRDQRRALDVWPPR